ncbi:methyl-accepting chemotaxis protein [Marinomonas ostreistagni]|uniref:methyl-accepting chemotaxis protein n=1 Tax=Marinomonas ostreistagni TaxID=359209 RepID=UPI0019523627|nr:methyl-accepting chemotaxis protein [Marinomonas ostreistagni]MBM6550943.1 methyl-accepting chemotaxis protein [Marinomonas ostreistagni]
MASFKEPTKGQVDTAAVQAAQGQQSGTQIIQDYNGEPVLSAYAPLPFAGLGWSILAEMDEAEAMAARNQMLWVSIALVILAAVVGLIVALLVSRMVLRPLGAEPSTMRDIADRIAQGDLTVNFNATQEPSVYRSMALMAQSLTDLVAEIRHGAQRQSQTAQELAVISEQTSGAIREQNANTTHIAAATSQLSSTSSEVSQTIQSVAQATQEAKSKVSQGAQYANAASNALENVTEELHTSGQKVDYLAQQVESISAVLSSIEGLSDQTNLLALNAAIEAARAGESGRGFAVVADEVRTLAQNTQKETEQIANIIALLQNGAKEAQTLVYRSIETSGEVASQSRQSAVLLNEAAKQVDHVDEMTLQIASAAEQQSSVTSEISGNVESLSASSSQIEQTVEEISNSSEEVARLSGNLNVLVDRFKVS